MKLGISILLSATVLSLGFSAQAQVPKQVEPQQFQKAFEEGSKSKVEADSEVEAPAQLAPQTKEGGVKLVVLKDINVTGSTVYSKDELKQFYSSYIGQKVSFNDLTSITNAITQKYRGDGYILSRANLAPQKIGSGVVNINIIEGYISDVSLAGDAEDIELIRKYAQKISGKRPINKKDLERYMLLADDLPGVTARSLIRPSRNTPGASELIINLVQDKFEGSASVDNHGTRFNGPIQLTGVAAFNSLFGIYDRTTVRGVVAPDDNELYFGDILHEEQLGGEGTKLKSRFAYSRAEPGQRLEPLDILGTSFVVDNNISYPHIRTRKENLTSILGFKTVDSESDIIGVNVAEDRVRTLYGGFTYDFEDMFKANNNFDIKLVKGVSALNATEDGVGRSRANGEHNFSKIVGEYTRLQNLYGGVSLFAGATAQAADSALLASEEAAYGGRRYGRAYDPAEIIGDNGMAGFLEVRKGDVFDANELLQSTQLYAFYDVAGVWNKSAVTGEPKKQTLASTGVGARFNVVKDVTGDVSVAVPMTRLVNANGTKHGDDPRFFFSLIKRF